MSSNTSVNENQDIIAYILLILTMIIWGGTWPLGRWLVAKDVGGATIPPLMIATIRYFLAIICFFLILKYKERTLNWDFARENWKILTLMGLLSVTIYQAGYLIGEIFTAASDASIMVATNAIWVVIISSIFLESELFTWKKLSGTILAFLAVIFVVGFSPNVKVSNRILGDILILLAAFAYAIYSVISRHFLNKTKANSKSYQPSSLWIITWVSFFGFLITTPISLGFSPEFLNPHEYFTIPLRIWLGIAYLAFLSTVGAYTFYLEGIKRLNASRAAIFQTLVPLFGVLFSAIFLQEKFDIFIYPFALLLVILGILLVNRDSSRKDQRKHNHRTNNQYREKVIDFETYDENEALVQMKLDKNFFSAALDKMKLVDNFDHIVPSGLKSFADFFFSNHDFIYQNQEDFNKIYTEFKKWLDTKIDKNRN
jgi:drug/metabolite transporter (DMT)-like permease